MNLGGEVGRGCLSGDCSRGTTTSGEPVDRRLVLGGVTRREIGRSLVSFAGGDALEIQDGTQLITEIPGKQSTSTDRG